MLQHVSPFLMGLPLTIAGWFQRDNPNLKWMISKGAPIYGLLVKGKSSPETMVFSHQDHGVFPCKSSHQSMEQSNHFSLGNGGTPLSLDGLFQGRSKKWMTTRGYPHVWETPMSRVIEDEPFSTKRNVVAQLLI